jgi:2-dehydro-3-deoxyphosphogluconate aldolase/(4S)-4-hydroxy-2-oxoglutarate aldolase
MLLKKCDTLGHILDSGVIAVIRADYPEKALQLADAVHNGGINAIEITMTVPDGLEVIRELSKHYSKSEVVLGAGTVLDAETARLAILAGAEFVVGPHLNTEMIRLCNRYQKICMPGTMSVREVVEAMELGAEVVKIFPGSLLGPDFVKAVKGPLPQASLIPTGGVSLDNVTRWIKAGAAAVGVGSEITKQGSREDNYELITRTARAFVEKIKSAREE